MRRSFVLQRFTPTTKEEQLQPQSDLQTFGRGKGSGSGSGSGSAVRSRKQKKLKFLKRL